MKESPRPISEEGKALIKKYEGCELESYECPGGVWTIGYGSTFRVTPGMTITEQEAEERLNRDLVTYESAVHDMVEVELSDNQYSALVSFCFNVGTNAMRESTLLKKLNAGDYTGAANELMRWDKSKGKKLQGLFKRRRAERVLFMTDARQGAMKDDAGEPIL